MAQVKLVMSAFGSTSAKDRFNRLIEQDQLQYDLLKESDPEVYDLVKNYLQSSNPLQEAYDQNNKPTANEDNLLEKLRELYDDLLKHSLK